MRRWTLKLRARILFFIISTCVICQCGLINGESKYSFLFFPTCVAACGVCGCSEKPTARSIFNINKNFNIHLEKMTLRDLLTLD